MTEAQLKKRLKYFANRMEVTKNKRTNPQGKRAYTLAKNNWRRTQRQLLCFQATGSIKKWFEYMID